MVTVPTSIRIWTQTATPSFLLLPTCSFTQLSVASESGRSAPPIRTVITAPPYSQGPAARQETHVSPAIAAPHS